MHTKGARMFNLFHDHVQLHLRILFSFANWFPSSKISYRATKLTKASDELSSLSLRNWIISYTCNSEPSPL